MSNDEQFSDHDYDSRVELNFWCSEDTLSHTVLCIVPWPKLSSAKDPKMLELTGFLNRKVDQIK